ncbi:zinc-binding alcohol dehydrogenase family protein [Cognatilysobacter tabacisoli]|uniref:zinc-binding alcohol dehydrogenase family protein n=1 Tax=Cognatilysobacter tabacisoli TaxID=2315424 RepID=UPI000E6B131D|nr:zinc-binding alcohol dehydrogenase family protein [Lysobacter tabacisoli]
MKAVALTRYLPIDDPDALVDVELPDPPAPSGHDVLVRVDAISVNPVDAKLRAPKPAVEASPRVLGFDAAGVVEAVGDAVTSFDVGDRVYYAGDVTRPGSNAQRQLVDARLIALAPTSLDPAQAAALPLTALTAWELLFERMGFDAERGGVGHSLLVIGGAGGVGSIAIQLARRAGFTVIATASRDATVAWCRRMGAHHVIDHRQALGPQLEAVGHRQVDAVLNLADTNRYWQAIGEVVAPLGRIGLVVGPSASVDIGDPYKDKGISLHWEFMFARAKHRTADMARQGEILARVAALVDAGELVCTWTQTLGPIDAAHLREAHRRMDAGTTIGKLALAGWT